MQRLSVQMDFSSNKLLDNSPTDDDRPETNFFSNRKLSGQSSSMSSFVNCGMFEKGVCIDRFAHVLHCSVKIAFSLTSGVF